MRRLAFPVLVILTLGLLAAPGAAQEKYPSRPIDFVVTWGAGGGADASAKPPGEQVPRVMGGRGPSDRRTALPFEGSPRAHSCP